MYVNSTAVLLRDVFMGDTETLPFSLTLQSHMTATESQPTPSYGTGSGKFYLALAVSGF